MKIFDDIKAGLKQAIVFERKNLNIKTNTLTVEQCEYIEPDNHGASVRAQQGSQNKHSKG